MCPDQVDMKSIRDIANGLEDIGIIPGYLGMKRRAQSGRTRLEDVGARGEGSEEVSDCHP